jgi:hypothetical protein
MDIGVSGTKKSKDTDVVSNNDLIDISPVSGYSRLYNFINNPASKRGNFGVIIGLIVIILAYYIIFASLGGTTRATMESREPSTGMQFMEIIMLVLLIFLILTNAIQYFFSLDIRTGISDLFSDEPELDIDIIPTEKEEPVPEITFEKQVYNIPGNNYSYDDAKAVCKAYGSRLATYEEIEKAYKDGAEWCRYGWSDNQMALFPTQKKTWDKLQKKKGVKHACGRPGINGGFIANPNVRFGVNCYGYKPEMTYEEQQIMNNEPLVPRTKEEREFKKKVEHYRKELKDILVSPFNKKQWSKI